MKKKTTKLKLNKSVIAQLQLRGYKGGNTMAQPSDGGPLTCATEISAGVMYGDCLELTAYFGYVSGLHEGLSSIAAHHCRKISDQYDECMSARAFNPDERAC